MFLNVIIKILLKKQAISPAKNRNFNKKNMVYVRHAILIALVLLITDVEAQRVLLLKKPATLKYYTYRTGSTIDLRLAGSGQRLTKVITGISDTSITLRPELEVPLHNIERIYRDRRPYTVLSKATRMAGAGYFVLDVFNRSLNNDSPVVLKNTAFISAAMIGFGYAISPLRQKKCIIGKPWVLQVLDFSSY